MRAPLVGEAMVECERLLRTSGELSAQANEIRRTLGGAVEDVEKHLLSLPGVAQQEAQRGAWRWCAARPKRSWICRRAPCRRSMRALRRARPSARTRCRTSSRSPSVRGLFGMARKLTSKPGKQKPRTGSDGKTWEMSKLLAGRRRRQDARSQTVRGRRDGRAGGGTGRPRRRSRRDPPATRRRAKRNGAVISPANRAVFARRLASAIDSETVDRVAALYREDTRFPRRSEPLSQRVRIPPRPRPRRRRWRPADTDDPKRRYGQDLSGDRVRAGEIVTSLNLPLVGEVEARNALRVGGRCGAIVPPPEKCFAFFDLPHKGRFRFFSNPRRIETVHAAEFC